MKQWIINCDVPDAPRSGDINNSIRYKVCEGDVTNGIWGWGSDQPSNRRRYNNGWHVNKKHTITLNIIPL